MCSYQLFLCIFAEQTVISCDFSTQKGLALTDGMCAFSQEGGEWFRTNEKTSAYGPSGDHTNGTSKYTCILFGGINSNGTKVFVCIQIRMYTNPFPKCPFAEHLPLRLRLILLVFAAA